MAATPRDGVCPGWYGRDQVTAALSANQVYKATPTNLRSVDEMLFNNSDLPSSVVLVASLDLSSSGSGIVRWRVLLCSITLSLF